MRWLKHLRKDHAPEHEDGLGQSFADDIRFHLRFRSMVKQPIRWAMPTPEEEMLWECHPVVGRFGDFVIGVAAIDGAACVILERMWHGWPDPPRYCVFALRGDTIWMASDFQRLPAEWIMPASSTSV